MGRPRKNHTRLQVGGVSFYAELLTFISNRRFVLMDESGRNLTRYVLAAESLCRWSYGAGTLSLVKHQRQWGTGTQCDRALGSVCV